MRSLQCLTTDNCKNIVKWIFFCNFVNNLCRLLLYPLARTSVLFLLLVIHVHSLLDYRVGEVRGKELIPVFHMHRVVVDGSPATVDPEEMSYF